MWNEASEMKVQVCRCVISIWTINDQVRCWYKIFSTFMTNLIIRLWTFTCFLHSATSTSTFKLKSPKSLYALFGLFCKSSYALFGLFCKSSYALFGLFHKSAYELTNIASLGDYTFIQPQKRIYLLNSLERKMDGSITLISSEGWRQNRKKVC